MNQTLPIADGVDLPADEVHVHALVVPAGFGKLPIGGGAAARVLSVAERDRFARYQVQRRRNDLVLSRVLIRVILAGLGLARPDDVELVADTNGKPHLTSRAGRLPLHLNGSDTTGMIIWALSRQGPLGCDVERIGADKDEIAGSHFAPQELADYRALAAERKSRRFYEVWTLKEALLKADGRGLGVPLDSFGFRFAGTGGEGPPGFEIMDPETGPAPGPWRFHGFRPETTHQAAVAVHTPVDVTFRTHLWHLMECDPEFARPWKFAGGQDRHFPAGPAGDMVFVPGR